MAITKISDIVIPEVFMPYLIEETTAKNAFIKSGIAAPNAGVDITRGGTSVSIPMWVEPTADDEILDDSTSLTVNAIKGVKDVALIHARGVSFGRNDLAALLAGDDPMKAIVQYLGTWWSKKMTKILVNSLEGAMGVPEMADSVLDESGNVLTADMMAEASYLLGDNYDKITAVAMAAPVLAKLKKLDLVDFIQPSELTTGYYTYMEKRVIVDDSLAATDGAYPIYFFGEGAIAYNENPMLQEIEYDRDILAGEDVLASRRVFTMHPRGIKFKGTPAGTFATNEELKDSSNWELVADRKNVAIAKLIAKVK